MANVDRANGFRPTKSLLGAPWTSLVRNYPAIAGRTASSAGDIYIGTPLTLTAAGNVQPAASKDAIIGVAAAVGTDVGYYDPDNLTKRYLAYDEAGVVGVVPAEGVLFSVQHDVAAQVLGATANIVTNAGDRGTGNATTALVAGTVDGDVVIVEHDTRPDNDQTAVNARYIVKFVKHKNSIDGVVT